MSINTITANPDILNEIRASVFQSTSFQTIFSYEASAGGSGSSPEVELFVFGAGSTIFISVPLFIATLSGGDSAYLQSSVPIPENFRSTVDRVGSCVITAFSGVTPSAFYPSHFKVLASGIIELYPPSPFLSGSVAGLSEGTLMC